LVFHVLAASKIPKAPYTSSTVAIVRGTLIDNTENGPQFLGSGQGMYINEGGTTRCFAADICGKSYNNPAKYAYNPRTAIEQS